MQRTGRRTHTQSFVLVRQKSRSRETRLGVTVSSKVGNAVARNRIKRRVRELFRTTRGEMPPGFDVVVIAKRGADVLTFHEIARELLPVFRTRD